MSSEKPPPTATIATRETLVWVALTLLAFATLYLPALLAASVLWMFVGRHLRRTEHLIVLAVAIVVTVVDPGHVIVEPLKWMLGVLSGDRLISTPPFPWLGIIGATLWFHAMIAGTSSVLGMSSVRSRIKHRRMFRFLTRANPFGTSSLIPSDTDRKRARLVEPPGGIMSGTDINHVDADNSNHRRFSIGVDEKQRPVYIDEGEITRIGSHGLILGGTGSGKTETIKSLVGCLLDLGWSGLVLDLKEDTAVGGLRDFLVEYSGAHAIPFQQLALSDPTPSHWFNPLDGMGADEARDTILSLQKFDDQHWGNINSKMLGQVVNLAYDAHEADPDQFPAPTMLDIGRVFATDITRRTRKMRAAVSANLNIPDSDERYSAILEPTAEELRSGAGFGAKLVNIYNTVAGRTVLRPDPEGHRIPIDVTANGLTYIGLDTSGKPDLSRAVSSAVLKRMTVYAAHRNTGRISKTAPRFIVVDEASAVSRPIVKEILARARSSRIAIFLATQSPEDWNDKEGDDWSTMVSNVNIGIVMAQGSQPGAELCADFIGYSPKVVTSQRLEDGGLTFGGSAREEIDFRVPPHELRSLQVGEAILRVNRPVERVLWMAVKRRDPKASPGVGGPGGRHTSPQVARRPGT